jgi:hypothetical protein
MEAVVNSDGPLWVAHCQIVAIRFSNIFGKHSPGNCYANQANGLYLRSTPINSVLKSVQRDPCLCLWLIARTYL